MTGGQKEPEGLPSKERLERLKLQAEIKEIEKPFYFKKSFIATISSLVVSLGVAGYLSGWFDIKLKRLENEKVLIRAEKIKLENEKLLLQKEYYASLSSYLKDLQINEKSPEVKERYNQYVEILPKVKKQYEYSFEDWYNKGVGEYVHKKFDKAISSFTNALSKESNNDSKAYAYNFRGSTYLYLRKFKEALADFKKSIKHRQDNPRPYANMAGIYLRQGHIDKAEEEIKIMNGLLEEGKLKGGEKAYAEEAIKPLKERLEEAKKKRG